MMILEETIQLQVPVMLLQQVQETNTLNKPLEQILIESIQLWLDQQHLVKAKIEVNKATQLLRDLGLVMSRDRQIQFAQAIKPDHELPERTEIELALAHFTPTLSEEIITMRGEV